MKIINVINIAPFKLLFRKARIHLNYNSSFAKFQLTGKNFIIFI